VRLPRNVGRAERPVRVALGVVLAGLAVAVRARLVPAVVLSIAAALLLLSALTGT
jgi:hypothetical protein